MQKQEEVVVYAKLPKGFIISTSVDDYNPDWAVSFMEGAIKPALHWENEQEDWSYCAC